MTKGETILVVLKQIDFLDQFRLKRGDLVTYMSDNRSLGREPWLMVMCDDGNIRPVATDEVSLRDMKEGTRHMREFEQEDLISSADSAQLALDVAHLYPTMPDAVFRYLIQLTEEGQ